MGDTVVGACGNLLTASTSLMKSEACTLVETEVEGEGGKSFREKRRYKILAQETGYVSGNEESLQGKLSESSQGTLKECAQEACYVACYHPFIING